MPSAIELITIAVFFSMITTSRRHAYKSRRGVNQCALAPLCYRASNKQASGRKTDQCGGYSNSFIRAATAAVLKTQSGDGGDSGDDSRAQTGDLNYLFLLSTFRIDAPDVFHFIA